MNEKQLSFKGAMMIVNGNKWIKFKDIEKLSDFIQEQQAIIEAKDSLLSILAKENEQLRKDVENLQEVVAELGATLLINGFEIEINGEKLIF